MENEKKLSKEQQKKVTNFDWDSSIEANESTDLFEYTNEEVQCCEKVIKDFVLKKIGPEHYDSFCDSKISLFIEIDISLHRILEERFKDNWDLDSRLNAIVDVNDLLTKNFDNIFNKTRLNNKIKEILPDTSRKEYVFSNIVIIDDPLVFGESGTIGIEIELESKSLE